MLHVNKIFYILQKSVLKVYVYDLHKLWQKHLPRFWYPSKMFYGQNDPRKRENNLFDESWRSRDRRFDLGYLYVYWIYKT